MGQITPRGAWSPARVALCISMVELGRRSHGHGGWHSPHWPSTTTVTTRRQGGPATRKTYDQQKHEIERFFGEAQAYASAPRGSVTDVRHEACGTFDGTLCLYVHTNDARAITEAVHFKRDLGIERMAIVGGYDATSWQISA